MAKPISFGELDFKLVASMQQAREIPEPETPFCILILGDFSGREMTESRTELGEYRSCATCIA